jgi:hypothetical protein
VANKLIAIAQMNEKIKAIWEAVYGLVEVIAVLWICAIVLSIGCLPIFAIFYLIEKFLWK